MGRVETVGVAALLVLALSGCTGGPPAPAQPSPTAAPSAAPVSLETGTDVGNGRPAVSHDGLMVRRRAVIAVHPAPDADLGALRARLERAAAAGGTVLSGISPDVLDPGVLEHLSPDLILALPPGSTSDDAQKLAERAFGPEGSNPGVEHIHAASVLVHDLQFTVQAADPAASAHAIAEEGILSDALGNYATSQKGRTLTVSYTGPLLSDALVESVRNGIARGAGVEPATVALVPRSTTGEGVDLSREPEPAPEPSAEDSVDHPGHNEGAAPEDTASDDTGSHDTGADDSGH
ncbi:hypothetical protein [Arthrobacter sp. 131MFCol6.1]|uniref:hypothetical protein n=1 Tax=Arthrobacter sp. 131MFCol6.1 TaxID=1157944 RepID=UPI0003630241|nr:hypothetical protein [Arthrobacter sp. 131MFCol6.1]